MNFRIRNVLSVSILLALITGSFATGAEAQDPKRAIEGTWFVQLTMRTAPMGRL